jgi:hypothetical protein
VDRVRLIPGRRCGAREVPDLVDLDVGHAVADIAFYEFETWMPEKMDNIVHPPRHQVVQAGHPCASVKKTIAKMTSEKTRAARHQSGSIPNTPEHN